MQGQHIFARFKNRQNNAGTWTAAVTEGILPADVIMTEVEPRCNLFEPFAVRTMVTCPNSILRIYHPRDDATVVTRSFWVKDRLTETTGRNVAYSVSHILTGEDADRFAADFGGAFDPACFESYDALVERVGEGQREAITLNTDYNIFSHRAQGPDPEILDSLGFTQESFAAMMSAVYHAVENEQQVALILPDAVQNAWSESGDDSAEQLLFALMACLPDFVRVRVGAVSHWGGPLRDKMIEGMHLIVLHPAQDGVAEELGKSGMDVIDLNGRIRLPKRNDAPNYFGFLWSRRAHLEEAEGFWQAIKKHYGKLLRRQPVNAEVMESLFLMESAISVGPAEDPELCRDAFLAAARVFAGAGTQIPRAEDFLTMAVKELYERGAFDQSCEEALCAITKNDKVPTKHQELEYKILMELCESGRARPETAAVLCDEVLKEKRNAGAVLTEFLTSRESYASEKLSGALMAVAAGIFTRTASAGRTTHDDIGALAFRVSQKWSQELLRNGVSEGQGPVCEAYGEYLQTGSDPKLIKDIYQSLLSICAMGGKSDAAESEKYLWAEEKRIYSGKAPRLDNAGSRLPLFAEALAAFFPQQSSYDSGRCAPFLDRMIRFACTEDPKASQLAQELYRAELSNCIGKQPGPEGMGYILARQEAVLPTLSHSEQTWPPKQIQRAILQMEQANLELVPSYRPSSARVDALLNYMVEVTPDLCDILVLYAQDKSGAEREEYLNGLTRRNLTEPILVYLITTERDLKLQTELDLRDPAGQADHAKRLGQIAYWADILYDGKKSADLSKEQSVFARWYGAKLQAALDRSVGYKIGPEETLARLAALDQERNTLSKLHDSKGFTDAALQTFRKFRNEAVNKIPTGTIPELSEDAVKLLACIDAKGNSETQQVATVVYRIDQACAQTAESGLKALDTICGENLNPAQRKAARERLLRHQKRKGKGEDVQLYPIFLALLEKGTDRCSLQLYREQTAYASLAPEAKLVDLINVYELFGPLKCTRRSVRSAVLTEMREIVNADPQAADSGVVAQRLTQFARQEEARTVGKCLRDSSPFDAEDQSDEDIRLPIDFLTILLCLLGAVLTFFAVVLYRSFLALLIGLGAPFFLAGALLICILLIVADVLLALRTRRVAETGEQDWGAQSAAGTREQERWDEIDQIDQDMQAYPDALEDQGGQGNRKGQKGKKKRKNKRRGR